MTELLQTIPHPEAQKAGLVPVVAWGDGNRSKLNHALPAHFLSTFMVQKY